MKHYHKCLRQKSKETHWVSLFMNKNTTVNFDSFGIEYIPQEGLNKIKDKCITHNILNMYTRYYTRH